MSIRRLLVAILLALGLTAALPAGGAARTLWLCRPGLPANACSSPLTVTRLSAQAERLGVTKVRRHPAVDCFYVYPTASDQPTVQAKRRIEPALRSIAR